MSEGQQQEINIDVARSLGRIEASLESLHEKMKEHVESDAALFTELTAKVTKYGTARATVIKWAAGVGTFVAAAAQALGYITSP